MCLDLRPCSSSGSLPPRLSLSRLLLRLTAISSSCPNGHIDCIVVGLLYVFYLMSKIKTIMMRLRKSENCLLICEAVSTIRSVTDGQTDGIVVALYRTWQCKVRQLQ